MSKTEEEKINLTDIIQNNSMSTLISITKAKERNPSAGNTHDHRHSYIIYVAPVTGLKKDKSFHQPIQDGTTHFKNNSMCQLSSTSLKRNPSAGITHDHGHSYIIHICSTSDRLKKKDMPHLKSFHQPIQEHMMGQHIFKAGSP